MTFVRMYIKVVAECFALDRVGRLRPIHLRFQAYHPTAVNMGLPDCSLLAWGMGGTLKCLYLYSSELEPCYL